MKNYEFQLQEYAGKNSRFTCPACGRPSFVRYVDKAGNYIAPEVGRCEHINSCGYELPPREYFASHPRDRENHLKRLKMPFVETKRQKYIVSFHLVQEKLFVDNNLMIFLSKYFTLEELQTVSRLYYLGGELWSKEIIFPQLDEDLNCRSGKIMQYDPNTGHRIKNEGDHVTWLHSRYKSRTKGEQLEQCLFGLHLIQQNKPICLVESEKSAIICALAKPHFTWLATGGKYGFRELMLKPLQGKRVTVFPDADACDDWRKKSKEIKCCHLEISDWCKEEPSSSKRDIADLILEELEQDRIRKEAEKKQQVTYGMIMEWASEAGCTDRIHFNI